MTVLVTGSAGHLGEALMRHLQGAKQNAIGLDTKPSAFTHRVGSITQRSFVRECMQGISVVLHAATLHKPHIATHSRQEFVDTNVTGTLNLLEEAVQSGVEAFIYTSTTSVFGKSLIPAAGAPAAWITEEIVPIPKNIYGLTKLSAEHLCELFHRTYGLSCIVLRTSRFFPEDDDDKSARANYDGTNLKVNELLYRRGDLEDMVSAHILAMRRAQSIGFGRYIISATTPFTREDLVTLREDAPSVVRRHHPAYEEEYRRRGWTMLPGIDRVYVSELAKAQLGWRPRYDFGHVIDLLQAGKHPGSELARVVGCKGYHLEVFAEGPYPV
jgi:UDP-glucose 4-epimerase